MTLGLSRCNQVGARLLLGLALLVVSYLALTPYPDDLQEAVNDKLGHAIAFTLLALLVHASWPHRHFDWRLALPLLGYGIAIEGLQHFIPGRFPSLWDIVADGAGIGLYLLLLPLLAPLIRNLSGKHAA